MLSRVRASMVFTALGLVVVGVVPAAMAAGDLGQPAPLDAATSTASLVQLCRDGRAEPPRGLMISTWM